MGRSYERGGLGRSGDRPKLVFIAGAGRSGSTLLELLLGQFDGVFAAGELHSMWHRGLIENRRCGCGLPFRHCAVWKSVFEAELGICPRWMRTVLTKRSAG